jgi:KUP system potassium uptake protein
MKREAQKRRAAQVEAHDKDRAAVESGTHEPASARGHGSVWKLTVGAIGIVFGDIGTSPLYAMKECFATTSHHAVAVDETNVLGILSLFFWSLTLVVTVKYVIFIMRADNKGEGGILSMLALLPGLRGKGPADPRTPLFVLFALFGAALLLGEGMLTPAISVLSAVEGLRVAAPVSQTAVVVITCVILLGLFSVQRRGTASVGAIFGPTMILWFAAISVLGLLWIVRYPTILKAAWPGYAVSFFADNGLKGVTVLGSVVLCVTGAEALYADMGHFGTRPIRMSWLTFVFPALLLNYFGQGAHLLHSPESADSLFFSLVPRPLLYPMVALATAATIIASQALISGAFSLARQSVQLGFMPRLTVVHTSGETEGQIYIPEVNQLLTVICLLLVLSFRESGRLAAAYGIAVTGTFAITSILFFRVLHEHWKWPLAGALAVTAVFLFADLAFFGANALKFFDGGWVPLAIALGVFSVMTTWKRGRAFLAGWVLHRTEPVEHLLEQIRGSKVVRVPGTAVFMTSNPNGVPPVLLHHLEHNQVLHDKVVLLSIVSIGVPVVPTKDRVAIVEVGEGLFQVEAHYGFMQTPNVPKLLRLACTRGLKTEPATTTYYLGRESLLPTGHSRMSRWRKGLFAFVSRNARTATSYFGIPTDRVVELGIQVEL